MHDTELRDGLLAELCRIAPDVDPATLDPRAPLRAAIDLDSMDFLNLLGAVHSRFGVEIPDADAGRLRTLQDILEYVRARLAA
jgi:acyl carrier protein